MNENPDLRSKSIKLRAVLPHDDYNFMLLNESFYWEILIDFFSKIKDFSAVIRSRVVRTNSRWKSSPPFEYSPFRSLMKRFKAVPKLDWRHSEQV